MKLRVVVKPNAKRSALRRKTEGGLEVALAAPPVEGRANEELVRLLAAELGLRKKEVVLVAGQRGRTKLIEVPLSAGELVRRIDAALARADLA